MPEKIASIIAHPILNLFAGITTLLVYFGLRSNTVSDKTCGERRKVYEELRDDVKEIRTAVIRIKTIIEEQEKHK